MTEYDLIRLRIIARILTNWTTGNIPAKHKKGVFGSDAAGRFETARNDSGYYQPINLQQWKTIAINASLGRKFLDLLTANVSTLSRYQVASKY
jgi:hypothetical protein